MDGAATGEVAEIDSAIVEVVSEFALIVSGGMAGEFVVAWS